MSSTSQRPSSPLASLLLLGLCVSLGSTHQCYVCGPSEQHFQKTCDDFQLNSTQYIETCPDKYFGCSTHFGETGQRKQCERMRINDCKKANGIEYCFCSSNLCNGVTGMTPQLEETDDEDILDEAGSGDGNITPPKEHPSNKDDIDVIIEDVGNSIDTIETKTSGCVTIATLTIKLSFILVILTFSLH